MRRGFHDKEKTETEIASRMKRRTEKQPQPGRSFLRSDFNDASYTQRCSSRHRL